MEKQNNEFILDNGSPMDTYMATAICEGFCEGEGASTTDQLKAWAFLIKTGLCWNLQGSFGRSARATIDSGLISAEGIIDWEEVNFRLNAESGIIE